MNLDQYPEIAKLAESLKGFGNSAEPHPEWENNRLWSKLYGGQYFDTCLFFKGWKTDYTRASRLFFITTAVTGSPPISPEYVPEKSTDLPASALTQVRKWLSGYGFDADEEKKHERQQVRIREVWKFLADNHDGVWALTVALKEGHDRKYYRRDQISGAKPVIMGSIVKDQF